MVLGCFGMCHRMFWDVLGSRGGLGQLSNSPTVCTSLHLGMAINFRAKLPSDVAPKKMWAPRAPQVLAGTVLAEDKSWRIGMNCAESCWPNISKLYPNRSEYKYIATLCSTQCITLRHETIRRYEPFVDWIGIDHHRSMEVQSAQFH